MKQGPEPLFSKMWAIAKGSVMSFVDDNVLSKGASIAFYTVTSVAPTLVIVIAVAGLAFGHQAAQGAITYQLSGLMGQQPAQFMQSVIQNASGKSSGIIATILGTLTLLISASGVFGEMQTALDIIWKVQPKGSAVSRFVKSRASSLGLVVCLGFLLMASLVASAVLSALGPYIDSYLLFGQLILGGANFLISFSLGSALIGAIYKILPDTPIDWRDAAVGAIATALLFEIGKALVGLYLGTAAVGSAYGAASGLIVLLFWIYASAQIFLFGAEFTKTYADSRKADRAARTPPARTEPPQRKRVTPR